MQASKEDVSFKGSGLTWKSSVTQLCLRQNSWWERLKSTVTAGEQVCLQGAEGVRDHYLCTEGKTFKSEFEEMPGFRMKTSEPPLEGGMTHDIGNQETRPGSRGSRVKKRTGFETSLFRTTARRCM